MLDIQNVMADDWQDDAAERPYKLDDLDRVQDFIKDRELRSELIDRLEAASQDLDGR